MTQHIFPRIAVVGMGAASAHGTTSKDIFWDIANNVNRVAPINAATHFDSSLFKQTEGKVVIASPLSNTELAELAGIAKPDRYDRHQLFALLAAAEAMQQAGYDGPVDDPETFAIVGATGDGGLGAGFDADTDLIGNKKLGPFANLKQLPNIFAGQLVQKYDLRDLSNVHVTACAASAHAIMEGARLIRGGESIRVLVGGTEAAITPFGIASFAAQRALGTDIRPYHKDRDGFVMGEGAAWLVLEDWDHAIKRGATILAELAGYGATSDGRVEGNALTDPSADGGYRAAMKAMKMAGIEPKDVEYVNTHGTGTPKGDAAEIEGILKWMDPTYPVFASSTKSYTGHLLGAAGAIEAVLCIWMMREGIILPTRGLTDETLDPALPTGVNHVPKPIDFELTYVMSNGFGFGGTNASLIFKKAA